MYAAIFTYEYVHKPKYKFTLSSIASMTEIFDETLLPPMMIRYIFV
jgi:hypothetical protein